MVSERQAIAATRFGTGLGPGFEPPGDAAGLLAQLAPGAAAPLLVPLASAAERAEAFREFRTARREDRESAETRELRLAAQARFRREAAGRVMQRAFSAHPFFERLAAFWAGHFSVSARGIVATYLVAGFEPEAIRPHVAGRFADLLAAAVLHPAMLAYLDQHTSIGPGSRAGRASGRGLNENLAREVLELHTLGAGGPYTQGDVRQFAELLTGHGIDLATGAPEFRPGQAEPGAETVLGTSYGGDRPAPGDAARFLADLAVHPGTAAHIARRLATHFVADAPPEDLVAAMARAFLDSGGDLPTVYAALLAHPAAWAPEQRKVRLPQELIAATLRASGVAPAEIDPDDRDTQAALVGGANRMGQDIFRAPGPDGWPEEASAWITPQGLAARLAWAEKAGHVLADRGLDPRAFAEAALGPLMREETRFLVGAAAEKWEGIALALASPEFNRR